MLNRLLVFICLVCIIFPLNAQQKIASYPATFTGQAKLQMIPEVDGSNYLLLIDNQAEFQMIQLNGKLQFLEGRQVRKANYKIPVASPFAVVNRKEFIDLFYQRKNKGNFDRFRIDKKKKKVQKIQIKIPELADFQFVDAFVANGELFAFQVNEKESELAIHSFNKDIFPETCRYIFPEAKLLDEETGLHSPIAGNLAEVLIKENLPLHKIYFDEDRFILTFDFDNILKTRTIFLNKKTKKISATDHWLGTVGKGINYATNSLLFEDVLYQVKATDKKLSVYATNLASRHLIKEWEFYGNEEIWDFFPKTYKESFSYRNPVYDSRPDLLTHFAQKISLSIRQISDEKIQLIIGSYQPKTPENIFYSLAPPNSSGESRSQFTFFPSETSFKANEGDIFYLAQFEFLKNNIAKRLPEVSESPIDKLRKYLRKNYLQYGDQAQMVFRKGGKWYLGYLVDGEYEIWEF